MQAEILPHDDQSVADVIGVLSEAFYDYPVMRWVLGQDRPDYAAGLQTLVSLSVKARIYRQEFLLGVRDGDGLAAAAIVSRPNGAPSPPEFYAFRQQLWAELGPAEEARYDAFSQACAPFGVEAPHLHLNMIGVRDSARGRGLGRLLMERVHELSATDPDSRGVSLTTELESNVPLYEHFGYRLLGQAPVSLGLTTWGFYRGDETP